MALRNQSDSGDGTASVGVIGVGHLGRVHARLWRDAQGVGRVTVFDCDSERASSVAGEFGLEVASSLDSLLNECEAVSIVTPTSTHASIANEAIGRGVHCFIEKPITSRYSEARELIDRAARAGVVVQVGHVERFNPAFLAIAELTIDPLFIETHRLAQFTPRATDVAVVLDLMIHDIDLTLCLVDSELTEIRASGVAVISDQIDIANARLEFANGCVSNLTASRISQRPMRKMRMFGRDAYVSIDFAKPDVEIFRIGDSGRIESGTTTLLGEIEAGAQRRSICYERPAIPELNPIGRELELFLSAIRSEGRPAVSGPEAAEALRVAEEIVSIIERSTGGIGYQPTPRHR